MLRQYYPEHAYRACVGTQAIPLMMDIGKTDALLADKEYDANCRA